MKKNYNIPATEVIALMGNGIMQMAGTSPAVNPNETPIYEGGGGEG